jgi:hypothetical protein
MKRFKIVMLWLDYIFSLLCLIGSIVAYFVFWVINSELSMMGALIDKWYLVLLMIFFALNNKWAMDLLLRETGNKKYKVKGVDTSNFKEGEKVCMGSNGELTNKKGVPKMKNPPKPPPGRNTGFNNF